MHCENCREAASTHRNRVHYKTRQQLHSQHDLVRGTESCVYKFAIYRTGHRVHRHSFIADDHIHGCHRLGHSEEERSALHEYRAESGDEAADLCVSQHYILIVVPANQPPVHLHMLHTFTDVIAARKEQPIINCAHDPVA